MTNVISALFFIVVTDVPKTSTLNSDVRRIKE